MPAPTHPGRCLACTPARPAGALTSAIAIPRQLPAHKQLRARFISFLHRMVESLGATILPYLPPALEVLLHVGADAQDLQDAMLLLNQLMMRFKAALAPLMQASSFSPTNFC
jgi:hypothetical protein